MLEEVNGAACREGRKELFSQMNSDDGQIIRSGLDGRGHDGLRRGSELAREALKASYQGCEMVGGLKWLSELAAKGSLAS